MWEIFSALQACQQAKENTVLVSVLADSGSAPRGQGAHMLVNEQGRVMGTIGGGAVEYEAESLAGEALAARRTFTRQYHLSRDLGMICGGEVLVEFRFIPADDPVWRALTARALALFAEGAGVSLSMGADGPCLNVTQARVLIFGGGHVAQALVPVLARLDFNCWVLDDRAEFCDTRLFPDAQKTLHTDYAEIGKYVQISPDDYVVVMTHGHAADLTVQRQAMRCQTAYLGVIGSRNKVRALSEKLLEEGFSAEAIATVHAPIGIAIKAETPAEIAISIAAELIQVRAERKKL